MRTRLCEVEPGFLDARGARWSLLASFFILLHLSDIQEARAQSFSEPGALDFNATTSVSDDTQPRVASDGAGNWVAVWESSRGALGGTIGFDHEILFSRSSDDGMTWTAAGALKTNAATDGEWAHDHRPKVVTDGMGVWLAIWGGNGSLGPTGLDSDIFVARSFDAGTSWSAPIAVNSNATTDSRYDRFPELATDRAGNWVVVWSSEEDLKGEIGQDEDIFVARSSDDGATWTPPAVLNSNAAEDSADDEYPRIATDGAGNWVAVWNAYDDYWYSIAQNIDKDVIVSRSSDQGATWTPAVPLNTTARNDRASDIGPKVAADGEGTWLVTWSHRDLLGSSLGVDWDILVSQSRDAGATWSDPTPVNTNAAIDVYHDTGQHPSIDEMGNWVVVWTSRDTAGGMLGTDMDLFLAWSGDAGLTWTDPAPLNSNAISDSGGDSVPYLENDGDGNWILVWTSDDTLDNTIGTDFDIVYATASLTSMCVDHHCVIDRGLLPPNRNYIIEDTRYSGDQLFVRNAGCPFEWPEIPSGWQLDDYAESACPLPGASTDVRLEGAGSVVGLQAHDSSHISMSGGFVQNDLWGWDDATVSMKGGLVAGALVANDACKMTITGSGFAVDGVPVPYGDLTAPKGRLTGILESGDFIDNDFYQNDADHNGTITLKSAPEPSTDILGACAVASLAWLRRAGVLGRRK
jgi:hypothetical protein